MPSSSAIEAAPSGSARRSVTEVLAAAMVTSVPDSPTTALAPMYAWLRLPWVAPRLGRLELIASEPALTSAGLALSSPAAPERASALKVLPPPVRMLSVGVWRFGLPETKASSTICVRLVATAKPLLSAFTVGAAFAVV